MYSDNGSQKEKTMYQHPDLMLTLAREHQHDLRVEAGKRGLISKLRGGRHGRHARSAREPSLGTMATAARPAGALAVLDTRAVFR
jgi:hypothetical protein